MYLEADSQCAIRGILLEHIPDAAALRPTDAIKGADCGVHTDALQALYKQS